MRLWLACVAMLGCTGTTLRVQPEAIDLDVDLAQLPPRADLRVFADDRDVTDQATFALTGTPIGTLAGAQLISDGFTGGAAAIMVSAQGAVVTVPVTATIRETRLVEGTPVDAPEWFAAGQDVAADQPIEPGDGAVVPPDLGKLEVEFGAADGDDAHEVAITAPYLDLHVYAPGALGPRRVDLDANEWRAIASTTRGDAFTLDVRSTKSGGNAPIHLTSAHVEVADLDASSLVFGGIAVDATGAMTGRPQLHRYDMRRAAVEPFVSVPADGSGCMGCHIAISPDGSRLVAAGMTGAGGPIVGMIVDTRSRSVTVADTTPWNTGTYDPSGKLVTSLTATGELTLRDGSTGSPITTLALGEPAAAPTISADGRSLAYAAMVAPEANNPAGTALRVRPWDAATASVGPAITVATDAGILAPQFSSDGAWLLYTRSNEPNERAIVGGSVVRADGSAPPIPLTTGAGDQIPRWASAVMDTRAGGRDPEPVVWVAFASSRAVGPLPGNVKSLWLAAFYPARGVLGRPFHLPGQTPTLFALHSPFAIP
jgi:hypothetical protein